MSRKLPLLYEKDTLLDGRCPFLTSSFYVGILPNSPLEFFLYGELLYKDFGRLAIACHDNVESAFHRNACSCTAIYGSTVCSIYVHGRAVSNAAYVYAIIRSGNRCLYTLYVFDSGCIGYPEYSVIRYCDSVVGYCAYFDFLLLKAFIFILY